MFYRFLRFLLFIPLTFTRHNKLFKNQWPRSAILVARVLPLCTAIIAASQISACNLNINIMTGNKPDIDALEKTLKVGVSTEQEVLNALGTPLGKGREMLPFMDKPRTAWTYHYAEGDSEDSRGLFLFVFFANQRYDGYMWFSSLPEFKPKLVN